MKLTGAKILIECLLEQGVDKIFGYPGGYVLDIYDELYKNQDKITHYITSHEQGAAHAADGYARVSGKTGVVLATSGPGATNLVTGIANAYMDSVPMVAITGNVALSNLGRDSFQEVDITGITMPITKHNYIVKDVTELADIVREAFYIAGSGRKGPVLIDIPKNIASEPCEFENKPVKAYKSKKVETDSVKDIAKAIEAAKKPVIIAGGGVIGANASDELIEFAKRISAPVGCTLMGLGSIDEKDPLSLGFIGMHGSYSAAKTIHESDLLIAIGARFSDRVAQNREKFGERAKIIHIDIDSAEINKNIRTDLNLMADAKEALKTLNNVLTPVKRDGWLSEIAGYKTECKKLQSEEIFAKKIFEKLCASIPSDSIITTDVGQHQMWTALHYKFSKPRTLLTSGGLGTMGYGLGAAIGASIAKDNGKVFLITGDGCFHMNLNELATLAKYNLPVVIFLMNNGVLGMVRQWQKLFYEKRFSHTTLIQKTDYMKLAEAFGVKGFILEKHEDIQRTIDEALKANGPALIDCRISGDENALPFIPPGQTITNMITKM